MIIKCNTKTICLPKDLPKNQKAIITLGNFDGVHLGHQALLKILCQHAQKNQSISVAITFEPHPQTVLTGASPSLLTTTKTKLNLLKAIGIDCIFQLHFTPKLANMTTEHFVQSILVKKLNMEELILGHDFSMGKKKSGTRSVLASLGKTMGYTVTQLPTFYFKKHVVSSSYIRKMIQEEGNMTNVAHFLGRAYSIEGTVIHGESQGKKLGFPTANLGSISTILPPPGVYTTLVHIPLIKNSSCNKPIKDTNNIFLAVTNIGTKPTFGIGPITIEVHLVDFNEELYGQQLTVFFLKKIREEITFPNISSLTTQIKKDILQAKTVFNSIDWAQPMYFEVSVDRMDATLAN